MSLRLFLLAIIFGLEYQFKVFSILASCQEEEVLNHKDINMRPSQTIIY